MGDGSTTARGYGSAHQRARAQYKPLVDAGQAYCTETICLMPARWIKPGTPWDLAHTPDRTGYLGPSHSACNRSEGSRRGNRMRKSIRIKAPRRMAGRIPAFRTSRDW